MVLRNTELKNVKINGFRGLRGIDVNFGKRITLICGKNGTSKSTILGIVAQVFSFRKNYSAVPSQDVSIFRTLTGHRFESVFSDHFRFSTKFDLAGSMNVRIGLYDANEDADLNLQLALYKYGDRALPRPIVRGNTRTHGASSSRNVTHPVVYLSLRRLMPIAARDEYVERDVEYLDLHKDEFKNLNNQLLSRPNRGKITATTGTISSVVVHSEVYDQQSVSAGEDNVGQILQAIFSFKKLKEEYPDYRGGILLIDEADAGLFPAAQIAFVEILSREAKKLNLQIIITSHSPTMIEKIFDLSKKDHSLYKTIYLTDTYGAISLKENFSWPDIYADLMVEAVSISPEIALPKVNVYFEDAEAVSFFKSIISERRVRKIGHLLEEVSLGCGNYVQLIDKKIPEFSKRSVIILDGDVEGVSKYKNIVCLPGVLPPDQLLFEFLYNLPVEHKFWKNKNRFTKYVFTRITADLTARLHLGALEEGELVLHPIILRLRKNPNDEGAIRAKFKEFFKSNEIQGLLKAGVQTNPFRLWIQENPQLAEDFRVRYTVAISNVLSNGHGVDTAIISNYLSSK